jgi:hypothetical protein
MYVLMFPCFLDIRSQVRTSSMLMGNVSIDSVHGVGTVNLKFTWRPSSWWMCITFPPSIRISSMDLFFAEMVLICFFESNKIVISKYGKFVGKGYECGGLFHLSLSDLCTQIINRIRNDSESNIWHSRLCHISFGCMTLLANMNLILKFTTVKSEVSSVCAS